jgi:hypothetical protein
MTYTKASAVACLIVNLHRFRARRRPFAGVVLNRLDTAESGVDWTTGQTVLRPDYAIETAARPPRGNFERAFVELVDP